MELLKNILIGVIGTGAAVLFIVPSEKIDMFLKRLWQRAKSR
jgi:hypothetical protein